MILKWAVHGAEIRMNSVRSMGSVKGSIYTSTHTHTGTERTVTEDSVVCSI